MTSAIDISSALSEIVEGKRSLIKIGNAYGGAMAICSLMRPALRDAFTGSGETNQSTASVATLREMLKRRDDVIYQAYELFQVVADSMTTIDEATANIDGNFDSAREFLTGQPDGEVNHD